ncbi:MAG: hypothetical protein ACR2RE_16125, partial [Geminicoccaceae bacterium]
MQGRREERQNRRQAKGIGVMVIEMGRRNALKGAIAFAGALAAGPSSIARVAQAAAPSGALDLGAVEALSALREKRFSARSYAEAVLARSEALSRLNIFINQDGE